MKSFKNGRAARELAQSLQVGSSTGLRFSSQDLQLLTMVCNSSSMRPDVLFQAFMGSRHTYHHMTYMQAKYSYPFFKTGRKKKVELKKRLNKNTGYPSRGLRFNSQHQHSDSQQSVIPVPEDQTFPSGHHCVHMIHRYPCKLNTHIHKSKSRRERRREEREFRVLAHNFNPSIQCQSSLQRKSGAALKIKKCSNIMFNL